MKLFKYQGAGNDFIILNGAECDFDLSPESISRICNRRFGVGADGLIVFGPSSQYDFSMKFFNSDGSSGMMCGNGGRCIISFASSVGIVPKSGDGRYVFEAPDGLHSGMVLSRDGKSAVVRLKMNDVHLVEPFWEGLYMNTGCPHLVLSRISGIEAMDVASEGPRWRHDPAFSPMGTNVDWMEIQGNRLRVRTFEKGVEGETLSCGTGVIAAAISSYIRFGVDSPVFSHSEDGLLKCRIRTTFHNLEVEFRPSSKAPYTDIWLTGDAVEVFRAEI
ncbi:MAG: diaminopimelate epimerase [Alistipes sp.]|nr:diaminopimelate epimerase [Candidatus Minthomonas equi]